jgi:hypothetical protein
MTGSAGYAELFPHTVLKLPNGGEASVRAGSLRIRAGKHEVVIADPPETIGKSELASLVEAIQGMVDLIGKILVGLTQTCTTSTTVETHPDGTIVVTTETTCTPS